MSGSREDAYDSAFSNLYFNVASGLLGPRKGIGDCSALVCVDTDVVPSVHAGTWCHRGVAANHWHPLTASSKLVLTNVSDKTFWGSNLKNAPHSIWIWRFGNWSLEFSNKVIDLKRSSTESHGALIILISGYLCTWAGFWTWLRIPCPRKVWESLSRHDWRWIYYPYFWKTVEYKYVWRRLHDFFAPRREAPRRLLVSNPGSQKD